MSQNDCLWAWSEHQHVTRLNPQLMMIFSFFFSFLLSLFCVLLLSTPSDVTSPLPLTIRFWLHFFFHLLLSCQAQCIDFFSILLSTLQSPYYKNHDIAEKEIFRKCGWNWNLIFFKGKPLHPHNETRDLLSRMKNVFSMTN